MSEGVTSTAKLEAVLAPGQQVGEYIVEDEIGRGGFGTVYRAVHPVIGKRVAIKVLGWRWATDDGVVARFAAEARAVNQIGHRHIIDIFSFSRLPDGRHYYAMELLDGVTLDHHLEQHGALALDEAVPILRAIARALDAAHAKGIAHRDLKPENVFLARDPDGGFFPKLLDFGIAKLLDDEARAGNRTATGMPIGTPAYMSPEQCRGRGVDHRTDIYSFGVLCYRVLTGKLPFEGDEAMDLMLHHMSDAPPPPSSHAPRLGPTIDAAIASMMHKDPARRPATVFAAIDALTPGRAPTPWPIAEPAGIPPVMALGVQPTILAPTSHRPRRTIAASVAMFVAVAGVLVITLRRELPAPDRATPAASTPTTRSPGSTTAPAASVSGSAVAVPSAKPPSPEPPPGAAAPATAHITLELTPASARALLDGAPTGSSFDITVTPTTHLVVVRAKGYRERRVEFVARHDETIKIDLARIRKADPVPKPNTGLVGGKDL